MRELVRGSPLGPEQIADPPVPPEHAVIPGQSIGPATLTATVEELTTRFGPSDYREAGLGYLVWSREWRTGLIAYVADDNTTVVGLETHDGRNRTDRGIEVGSSQGAVLLAYGMRPRRLEMTIPGHGPMRILVYDELGIAFGVVSEAALAQRVTSRIPVGLVKWMTAFSPRAGGRIYPLPGGQ